MEKLEYSELIMIDDGASLDNLNATLWRYLMNREDKNTLLLETAVGYHHYTEINLNKINKVIKGKNEIINYTTAMIDLLSKEIQAKKEESKEDVTAGAKLNELYRQKENIEKSNSINKDIALKNIDKAIKRQSNKKENLKKKNTSKTDTEIYGLNSKIRDYEEILTYIKGI